MLYMVRHSFVQLITNTQHLENSKVLTPGPVVREMVRFVSRMRPPRHASRTTAPQQRCNISFHVRMR